MSETGVCCDFLNYVILSRFILLGVFVCFPRRWVRLTSAWLFPLSCICPLVRVDHYNSSLLYIIFFILFSTDGEQFVWNSREELTFRQILVGQVDRANQSIFEVYSNYNRKSISNQRFKELLDDCRC